jgi:hypothetical protein
MYKVFRGTTMSSSSVLALALAAGLLAAAPAAGQLLPPADPLPTGEVSLLRVDQTLPLIGTVDNPCTAEVEAIAFDGDVRLVQEVWQLPDGNLRLLVSERTSLQGRNTLPLGESGPRYAVDAAGTTDMEFAAQSLSVHNYKRVFSEGMNDNFHTVLVLAFDPSTLKLDLRLEGSCDSDAP